MRYGKQTMILAAAVAGVGLMASSATAQVDNRPWEGTSVIWTGAVDGDWSNPGNWTAVENRPLQTVTEGEFPQLVYTNPPTNTTPAWGPDLVTVTVPGNTLGAANTVDLTTNDRTYDTAVFNNAAAVNKTVEVDPNRKINQLNFSTTGYTVGGVGDNHPLHLSSTATNKVNVTGAGTVATIAAPLRLYVSGQVAFTVANGATLNFDGEVTGVPASGQTQWKLQGGGATGITNFNAPMTGAMQLYSNSSQGTIYLNAANTHTGGITFDQTNAKVVLTVEDAISIGNVTMSRGGHVEITAENALSGTSSLTVNGNYHNAGTQFAASAIIRTANDYTGNTSVGGARYDNGDSLSTLLILNDTGSATGSGNVTVGGLLAGTGQIINSGAGRGVVVNNLGRLSPGDAAGEIGNLRFSLGDNGLNISGAVGGDNVGALLFDLDTPEASDLVNLLASTLNIGAGVLEFDDFAFNPLSGFGVGEYTLFNTNAAINGTLGENLSGSIGDFTGTIGFSGDGQDLILTVVPEPGTLGMLAIGAMGLMARRRRV